MEKMYKVKEVAEILEIHRNSVMNMIKDGRIKAFKLGNKYIIKESVLNILMGGSNEYNREIKDISRYAFTPNRKFKLAGNSNLHYEFVGEHTSWHINCDVCGEAVDNTTEIDIYDEYDKVGTRARINACHYCNNTHVFPTLSTTEVNGDVSPQELATYILGK